jgi:hypothetical protein
LIASQHRRPESQQRVENDDHESLAHDLSLYPAVQRLYCPHYLRAEKVCENCHRLENILIGQN